MDCPYCKKAMKACCVQSSHQIFMLEKRSRGGFAVAFPMFRRKTMTRLTKMGRDSIPVFLCEGCKKVIFDCEPV